jgi:hypothetical protein
MTMSLQTGHVDAPNLFQPAADCTSDCNIAVPTMHGTSSTAVLENSTLLAAHSTQGKGIPWSDIADDDSHTLWEATKAAFLESEETTLSQDEDAVTIEASPSKSSRNSRRRRRRQAEASMKPVSLAKPAASAVPSDASTASGCSPGGASMGCSEDDVATIEKTSSRKSSDASNTATVMSDELPKQSGPLLDASTVPVQSVGRNVVTWSDLLGQGAGNSMVASHPVPQACVHSTSSGHILEPSASHQVSAAVIASPAWTTLYGGGWPQQQTYVPHPPTHWPAAAGVPFVAAQSQCGLNSWLSASGFTTGQMLAAELQAVAPQAYED